MVKYVLEGENLIIREEEFGNPPGRNGGEVIWECGCTLKTRCEKHTGEKHPAFNRPVVFGFGPNRVEATYGYVESRTGKRPLNNGDVERFLRAEGLL